MDETIRALERAASQGDQAAREKLERARSRAAIHETTADVLGELEALEDRLRPVERAFRDEGLKDLRRYVEAAFEREPGLNVIVVRGYTPGFCDGDLCEHSQTVVIHDVADLANEESETPVELPANEVAAEAARAHERALGEFEAALHAQYGTDWQLTLLRPAAGEQVQLARVDWSCGY